MWVLWWLLAFTGVFAKSYSIDKVDIQGEIAKDGSMNLEQRMEYNFEGSYSNAYIEVVKAGENRPNYNFSNFEVCEDKCFYQAKGVEIPEVESSRPEHVFYASDMGDRWKISWYFRSNNQKKIFNIKYKINNAVSLGSDVDEFYWKFIGDEWSMPIKNVTAMVSLPDGVELSGVKAWGHGPLDGKVSIDATSPVIKWETKEVPQKTFFEGRVVWPKGIVVGGVNKQMDLAGIASQERDFAQKKTVSTVASLALSWGFGALGLLLIGWQIKNIYQKITDFSSFGKDVPLAEANLSGRIWEPPSNIDPAQIEQLINGTEYLTPKSFTATVLSLVRDRFYRIERSKDKMGLFFPKYHYFIVKTKEQAVGVASGIHREVMIVLDKVIGTYAQKDEDRVDLEKIKDWAKDYPSSARTVFTKTLPKTTLTENLF